MALGFHTGDANCAAVALRHTNVFFFFLFFFSGMWQYAVKNSEHFHLSFFFQITLVIWSSKQPQARAARFVAGGFNLQREG